MFKKDVNDVFTLDKCNVGFSLGMNGTDIAAEVSSIILLENKFSSII